nr:hypothetical protein [Streptomyces sasae]
MGVPNVLIMLNNDSSSRDALEDHHRLSVLLVMRDDFYPRLAAVAPQLLEAALPGLLNVPAVLSRHELHDIVTLPAREAGAHFAPGLPGLIVTDVLTTTPEGTAAGQATATVLPLVEVALSQLWQRRHEGFLTHEAYQRIGGVTGSLATWADTALDRLPRGQRPIAQRILTSLVRPADPVHRVPAVRAQVPLRELRDLATVPGRDLENGDFDEVLAALTAHRIVTTHTPGAPQAAGTTSAQPVAELIHDALIRDWGTLHEWVRQDHHFLGWLEHARAARARWAETNDPGDLLTGTALAEGLEWAQQRRLPGKINAYLTASRQRQQEVIRRSRRLSAVLACVLALVLIAAGGVVWQWRRARAEQQADLSLVPGIWEWRTNPCPSCPSASVLGERSLQAGSPGRRPGALGRDDHGLDPDTPRRDGQHVAIAARRSVVAPLGVDLGAVGRTVRGQPDRVQRGIAVIGRCPDRPATVAASQPQIAEARAAREVEGNGRHCGDVGVTAPGPRVVSVHVLVASGGHLPVCDVLVGGPPAMGCGGGPGLLGTDGERSREAPCGEGGDARAHKEAAPTAPSSWGGCRWLGGRVWGIARVGMGGRAGIRHGGKGERECVLHGRTGAGGRDLPLVHRFVGMERLARLLPPLLVRARVSPACLGERLDHRQRRQLASSGRT